MFKLAYIVVFLGAAVPAALAVHVIVTETPKLFRAGGFFPLIKPLLVRVARDLRLGKLQWANGYYKKKLIVADHPGKILSDEFLALKVLACIVSMFAGLVFGGYGLLGGSVLGFFLPDIWLRDQILRRRKEIIRALPGFIDMVALAVQAGADFNRAIAKVIGMGNGNALTSQFQQMFREIRVGTTRRDALQGVAGRVGVSELTAFTSALVQADRLGASLTDTLLVQAELVREARFRRAEKLGNEAPVKMLGPLVLFIFPATFIVLLAPIALQFIGG